MMVKLTSSMNKRQFALQTSIVLVCEPKPDNPLETTVVTSLSSPKGLVSYSVLESPEEIADLISLVEGKEPPAPAPKPAAVVAS